MAAIGIHEVFNAVTVTALATQLYPTGDGIKLRMHDGYFSARITCTSASGGDVTATAGLVVEYALAVGATDFITPTGASALATAHSATCGPDSDGTSIYSFAPEVAEEMKIRITSAATAGAVVSLDLAVK